MAQAYRRMAQFLQQAQNLLLVGHVNVDADCLGSMLALWHLFGGAAQGWQLALLDEVPPYLQYLPGWQLIRQPPLARPPQALLYIDCGSKERAGGAWLDAYDGLPQYCIDHHISNQFQGQLTLVEPQASSSGELVCALAEAAGCDITLEAATCIYSAMVADTGCFRYDNTTPRALEMAARLLRLGVDNEQARVQLFESRSPANMAMVGLAFANMQSLAQGRLNYTFVRHRDMLAHRARGIDLRNITNYTLAQEGAKIGLFFEEYEDVVKISLRCRRGYRVDELARRLGGGGHLLAAGAQVPGRLEQAVELVVGEALRLLDDGSA